MGRKQMPDWIKEAEEETCGGCFKVVDGFNDVMLASFPAANGSYRFHKCRRGDTYPLAADQPKAKVVVCRVKDCDSARIEGEEQWHTYGKSFALQTERFVGEDICWKHQPAE